MQQPTVESTAEVLGDSTVAEDQTDILADNTVSQVKGATDVIETDNKNTVSNSDSVEWYWWLGLIIVIAGWGWWIFGAIRRRQEQSIPAGKPKK